jgi:GcrA cell cycle regulator
VTDENPMRGDLWNDERIELLKRLWAEGATANLIAAQLGGISRSAVLGKIFRLRLGASTGPPPSASPHDSGAKPPRAARTATSGAAPAPVTLPKSLARRRCGGKRGDSSERASAPAHTRRKSLLELTNDSCRWPHGRPGTPTFFFCGALGADLEHGMPYCERHARRAYLMHESAPENTERTAASAAKLRTMSAAKGFRVHLVMLARPRVNSNKREAG